LRLLLDSHVIVWWLSGSRRLGEKARKHIMSPGAELYVSAASWWELSIKRAHGRLDFDMSAARAILQKNSIVTVPVTFDHADSVAMLASHHGDPFDRMLIAQASFENLLLLTRDKELARYGSVVLCV
jgi:PIN domain nuclease of toxin-antitoxin system